MPPPQSQSEQADETEQALSAGEAALGAVIVALLMSQIANTPSPSVPIGTGAYQVAQALSLFGKSATNTTKAAPKLVTGGLQLVLLPLTLRGVRVLFDSIPDDERGEYSDVDQRAIADEATERAIRMAATSLDATTLRLLDDMGTRQSSTRSSITPGADGRTAMAKQVEVSARAAGRWLAREAILSAQEQAAMQFGFRKKRWITERDERVRDAHKLLHRITVDLGGIFSTQHGDIRYPGDMSAPLHLTINCRCSLEFLR